MTEAHFLAEILANPADDDVRLVFADWLDDHGHHDRAEFVRVQVELSWLEEWDERYAALKAREKALMPPLPRGLPRWASYAWYRRGFVGGVQVTRFERTVETDFEGYPDFGQTVFDPPHESLWSRHPLEELRCPSMSADLLAIPTLRHFRRLEVHSPGFGLRDLILSPNVGPLESLSMGQRYARPGDGDSLDVLFSHPDVTRGLKSLRLVGLNAYRATDAELSSLGSPDCLPALTHLRWPGGLFGRSLVALARSEAMPRLIALDASESPGIDVNALKAFARAFPSGALQELRLRRCGLNLAAAAAVGSCRGLSELRVLTLADNPFGDMGCHWATRQTPFPKLAWLNLAGCALTDESVATILEAPFAATLRRLDLGGNRITAKGLMMLYEWDRVDELEELSLTRNYTKGGETVLAALKERLGERVRV